MDHLYVLYSSGSSGTGSIIQLPTTKQSDLVIQVAPGNYAANAVQIFGSVANTASVALPGYSITGSTSSPTITNFVAGIYVIPNVGGLVIEPRVSLTSGNGVVFAKIVNK